MININDSLVAITIKNLLLNQSLDTDLSTNDKVNGAVEDYGIDSYDFTCAHLFPLLTLPTDMPGESQHLFCKKNKLSFSVPYGDNTIEVSIVFNGHIVTTLAKLIDEDANEVDTTEKVNLRLDIKICSKSPTYELKRGPEKITCSDLTVAMAQFMFPEATDIPADMLSIEADYKLIDVYDSLWKTLYDLNADGYCDPEVIVSVFNALEMWPDKYSYTTS